MATGAEGVSSPRRGCDRSLRTWSGESSGFERRYDSLASAHCSPRHKILLAVAGKPLSTHLGGHVCPADDPCRSECSARRVNVGCDGTSRALRDVDKDDASLGGLAKSRQKLLAPRCVSCAVRLDYGTADAARCGQKRANRSACNAGKDAEGSCVNGKRECASRRKRSGADEPTSAQSFLCTRNGRGPGRSTCDHATSAFGVSK